MAWATETPARSFSANSSGGKSPVNARLPKKGRPKRTPSSSANPTTSTGKCVANSASSMPIITPRMPSNMPARGTVSRCEPIYSGGPSPPRRPRIAPAPSTATLRPVCSIQCVTLMCASRIAGERNMRVMWPGSSVDWASDSQRAMTRRAFSIQTLITIPDRCCSRRAKSAEARDNCPAGRQCRTR